MSGEMRLTGECRTCAKAETCGVTFRPHIEIGDCGHCDGCLDWWPSGEREEVRHD